jgi:hypothetical protein
MEMKRIKPDVPIILYSGTLPDELLGADVFISKGESVHTFLRIVNEVVERYRSWMAHQSNILAATEPRS